MPGVGDKYRFAGFEFDPKLGRVFDASATEVRLRPKPLELLAYLVGNPGRVVSKGELLEAVWPDVTVTEDSLTQCVSELRRALGDETNKIIPTVPRRGYMFIEPTTDWELPSSKAEEALPNSQTEFGRPTIVVRQFQNLGDDPTQEHIPTGFSQDIATELSRFSFLSIVTAFDTSPSFMPRLTAPEYIVEGSVRRIGDRIRVGVRLLETAVGSTIWSERYDSGLEDMFDMQDRIVAAIVGGVEGKVTASVVRRARHKQTDSWSAYECLLKGRALLADYREPEAIVHLRHAIAIDPEFGHGHALLAICLVLTFVKNGQFALLSEAVQAAAAALDLDFNDANAHWAAALTATWQRDMTRAGMHFDQAIALNPAERQIQGDRANWLRFCGRAEECLAEINSARDAAPFPPRWFAAVRAYAYFDLKRYDDAIREFSLIPPEVAIYDIAFLAAAHAHLGDMTKAAEAYVRAETTIPGFTFDSIAAVAAYANRSGLDHLLDGLRIARDAASGTQRSPRSRR